MIDCVKSFGFAEEAIEIVAWAPAAEILNPRRLKRYLNTLSVTLQLVMAYSLPEEFDNAYALRALALRRDWRHVYDGLAGRHRVPGAPPPVGGPQPIEWPQRGATAEYHAAFRAYLAKLRPETGALGACPSIRDHRFRREFDSEKAAIKSRTFHCGYRSEHR